MMQGKCKRCSGTLIEIEDSGTRLIGCLECIDWRSIDGLRRVKLVVEKVKRTRGPFGHPLLLLCLYFVLMLARGTVA